MLNGVLHNICGLGYYAKEATGGNYAKVYIITINLHLIQAERHHHGPIGAFRVELLHLKETSLAHRKHPLQYKALRVSIGVPRPVFISINFVHSDLRHFLSDKLNFRPLSLPCFDIRVDD